MQTDTLFRAQGLSKAFFGNQVLDDVSFEIKNGEVFGLVGENGAGKSTLTKIITGVYAADSGKMWFGDQEVVIQDVRDAKEIGIGVVFQELSLCLNLTVAENIFVDEMATQRLGILKRKDLYARAQELLKRFNVEIRPDEKVSRLTMGNRQIIEILKALVINPRLLILDEPTSSLGDTEIKRLFELIREIKKKNFSVIYISHHLHEIFEITDRVMVLRDGKKVDIQTSSSISINELVRMMINDDIHEFFGEHQSKFSEEDVLYEVRDLGREPIFRNISFKLHRGEILGIAGIIGSGKIDLCKSLFGMGKCDIGTVLFDGKELKLDSTADALKNGIVFLPESRKTEGLFLRDTVQNNIITNILNKVSTNNFIQKKKIRSVVAEYIQKVNIKARSQTQRVTFLSGGNQQKVLLSKCLATDPRILFAVDPTRGIDVGSKAEIHKIINQIAGEGVAIILLSSEIDELIALSDRIVVLNNGNIGEIIDRERFDGKDIRLSMHKIASNE
jgi:ABC-type sugar transport system ATPase subunit